MKSSSSFRLRVLAALCLLAASTATPAAQLLALTTEFAPFQTLRDGQPEGFAVEVVRELIRRNGNQARIELLPWTRAYFLAKSEADTGLFSVVRTAEREALFQWVGPILRGETRFYSLKSSKLRIDTLEDAARAGTLALP